MKLCPPACGGSTQDTCGNGGHDAKPQHPEPLSSGRRPDSDGRACRDCYRLDWFEDVRNRIASYHWILHELHFLCGAMFPCSSLCAILALVHIPDSDDGWKRAYQVCFESPSIF